MATTVIHSVVASSTSSSSVHHRGRHRRRQNKNICDCIIDCCNEHNNHNTSSTSTAESSLPSTYQPNDNKSSKSLNSLHNSCACINCSCAKKSSECFHCFTTANISTSTTFAEHEAKLADASEDNQPIEHSISAFKSFAELGALQKKQSPLFGRKTQSNLNKSASFSLRPGAGSKDTATGQNLKQKIIEVKDTDITTDENANVDRTATEAIRMNRSTAISNSKNGTNKNNGHLRNGTIMTSANTEKREHLYKILVIGELGTGKTSFIKRYVHQFFSQNYRATIGVDFALKVLHWDANTIVRLQLWDIAGQERFGNMTRVYYKEAVGAFIVFDVTRSGTFDCVSKWKEDLDSKVQLPDGSPIPCILLANKCDQEKQGIVTSPEKMDEYVHENGFAGWFETSAKENINIDESARALVNKILLNDKLISAADLADSEKFNLNSTMGDETELSEAKSKCSC